MNPFTTPAILADILADQVRIGADVLREKWPQAAAMLPAGFSGIFGGHVDP